MLETDAIYQQTLFEEPLPLTSETKDHCAAVFADIVASKDALKKAIAAQQKADCHLAQTFNHLVRNGPPLMPGQITTITFDHKQTFELRNRAWGYGSADIKGPGDLPWFQVLRTNQNGYLWSEMCKNCSFAIANMNGEPLLAMQEQFSWSNYIYDLYRYDPHRPGVQIPVCRITRKWTYGSLTDRYVVELLGPMAYHHPPVSCSGRWPNQFTLKIGRAHV